MLWSAWGDAIGFPAELVGEKEYQRRLAGAARGSAVTWRKTIGGRFGVDVELPLGAYSDDTQLRLATSRAIRSDGEFDVEVFSKVELTVWLSYALGAGRGSKAAATSLASSNIAWFSNFFDNKYAKYLDGGGNGAAMRIQPHVWASSNLADPMSYMKDVVRNAICTHGHCRGLLGAVIHAEHLSYAMRFGAVPPSETWLEVGRRAGQLLLNVVESESELRDFWLPTWEKLAGAKFAGKLEETVGEWVALVEVAVDIEATASDGADSYQRLEAAAGGLDPSTRGSGLLAALLAVAGSVWLEAEGAKGAITVMGTLIGSDTNTIASMAGALIGSCSNIEPPTKLQDESYLKQVSERMSRISVGQEVDEFIYPDLLYWQPPKTALDAVSAKGRVVTIAGLGRIDALGKEAPLPRAGGAYRWFSTWFGQSVLCKYRTSQKRDSIVGIAAAVPESGNVDLLPADLIPADLFTRGGDSLGVDYLSTKVIEGGYDPRSIGEAILELSKSERPIENSVALVSIVMKALISRNKGH